MALITITIRSFSLLLFVLFVVSSSSVTTAKEQDCIVLNDNNQDVTLELYDPIEQLVNCTGSRSCFGYTMNHCRNVYCNGMEACNAATIMDLSGTIQCLETHACHHTNIHSKVDKDALGANATCSGNGACDVVTMTNMNIVTCLGSKGCRKAHIHAHQIQCNDGGTTYETCGDSATFLIQDCLYCGHRGCRHVINKCRYQISNGGHVDVDYWDGPWSAEKWIPCPENQMITGTTGDSSSSSCLAEWQTQYEQDQHGLESDGQDAGNDEHGT